ncbi:glycosyl transferase family 2 [Nanobdella aerobiophila]|uniref:Glycosyl transferase family 2 n=1 Tax=Nanobdella aerobiophila TaxID=2586965 RepID=A0A915WRZ4_9ARCH|nr:glycosyltransferase family 2 protein [Nanobdella aerobiophila]BBL45356.1 glycosyl transferase family 2 [Nanobdella aerobiophila]
MLLFISAILLLLDILILSFFDLRYIINYEREIEIPNYRDLDSRKTLFVLFPVKNENQDMIINKIEYLKNIENKYDKLDLNFVFIDDTSMDREDKVINYLENNMEDKYMDSKFIIYKLANILYIFRLNGIKRKGKALDDTIYYLKNKYNIDYVSIYDFEWTVTVEYLYKGLCILESNKDLSFIYWNRRTVPVDYFHKIVGIYVDTFFQIGLPMKNLLDNISMIHGSCGIIRLEAYFKSGGFTAHLTEDASLTLRMYINGYKGLYIRRWVEYGQNLPPNFNVALKTLRRWQTGTFDVVISNFINLIKNKKLSFKQKSSFIHMFSAVFLPLISFILIIISIMSIYLNISSKFYQHTFLFFYLSPIYIIGIILSEYYIVEKMIYNKGSLKDAFLVLLISWGISALTIVYYLRRIILGLDNQWIVTKKQITSYKYDIYSILVLSIFLLINLSFFINSLHYLIYYYNYTSTLYVLFSLFIGNLSTIIWILSIFLLFYLQYKSKHSESRTPKNLLYIGIANINNRGNNK